MNLLLSLLLVMLCIQLSAPSLAHSDDKCGASASIANQERNVKVVKGQVEKYLKGDFEGFLKAFHPNCRFQAVSMSAALPLFRNYDGNVPQYFQTFGESYEMLSLTFDRAAAVDDYVLWRAFFLIKHRVTKKEAKLILNAAWKFDENGKVISAEDQFDTAALINIGFPGPTPYDNEVIATRLFEGLNGVDAMNSVKTLFAEDAVFYGFGGPQAKTRAEYIEYMQQQVLSVCSPKKFIIDDIMASSTSIYVKHRFVGKHTLAPYQGIKPSGKEVTVTAITHMVVRNGLIIETTLEGDFLGLMVQLGAVKM
jgi:hypothetical protein